MNSPYPDPGQLNIDAAFSSAEALFGQRRFEEASKVYTNVLSALETQYGQSHPELAFPLQRLGDCFHALNRYRESLPLYLRLLDIGEKILGKTHPDMLNLMIKVAKTQEMIGSFQDSKKTFEALLPLLESSLGPEHELFKSSLSEYELLNERIVENKRAAEAWKEGSDNSGPQEIPGNPGEQAVPAGSGVQAPGSEPGIAISDNQADQAAWDNAKPIQGPGSNTVFGAGQSMPPVPPMPPLPTGIPGEPDKSDAYSGTPVAGSGSSPFGNDQSPAAQPPFGGGSPGGPPSGQPPFGGGSPGGPPSGQPPFGGGSPGGPPSGQPPFGGGSPGGPPSGQPPFGGGSPGGPPSGRPPFEGGSPEGPPPGQPPFGQGPGGPPSGQPPFGQGPGGPPSGQPPFGQGPGGAPAGLPPFGQGPGGAPAGQPPFGQGSGGPPAGLPPFDGGSPGGPSQGQPPTMAGNQSQGGRNPRQNVPGGSTFPPVNSVGPVTAIPNQDAVPIGGLGFEERRTDPSNDPYVEHLATRVSELKPDLGDEEAIKKSGAWHGSDVMKNLDISKLQGSEEQSSSEDEYDDYDEEKEERQLIRSQKLKAARSAASKSSGIVTLVRGIKEYLITLIAISIFVVGGYYFFTHTEQKRPELVSSRVAQGDVLEDTVHVYHTSDGALKLNLDGVKECTLYHRQVGIKVPYNKYDGSPNTVALQMFDSLLERQHWFNEASEGMITEQGVVFYSHKSPDWKVLTEMRRLKDLVSAWHKVTGGYPSDLQKIPTNHFSYVNAFTGAKENMKITIVRYKQLPGNDIRSKMLRGSIISGEGPVTKGRIMAFTVMETNNKNDMKPVAFYIRGVNSHGQFFQSSDPGEHLLIGFKGGVDDGNEHIPEEEANLFRTEKPTKVWISKLSTVPVALIHHSLPILLGVIGFFFILRSMMVAPGQSADNHLNRTLRLIGIVIILANLVVIVVQFLLWR